MTFSSRTFAVALALIVALLGLAAPASSSAPLRVALAGPADVAPGESATLTATITGAALPAGSRVTLEHKAYGLLWTRAATGTLDDAGQAQFTVSQRTEGTYAYRVAITNGLRSTRSATYTLVVATPVQPAPAPAPSGSTPTPSSPSTPSNAGQQGGIADKPCAGQAPRKADGSAWTCTYSDEFDGTELDRDAWYPQVTATSGVTNGTKTLYTCYDDRDDVIAVRDGHLELSMVRLPNTVDCGKGKASQYVAGQVSHFGTHSQTYGKYEIRARFPDVRRPGLQSAIWLWPVDQSRYGAWPLSGEIDIVEHYSSHPDDAIPRMHYLAGMTNKAKNRNVVTGICAVNPGEFNTYGLEWEPRRLRIFVNGDLCIENNYSSPVGLLNANAPFDHPFFLALTQMMGTTGNEYDPAVMPARVTTQVDYVRIWQ
ncbi:glycoside hydrolase family 16 protein [Nocardioides sp. AE5]|uniref:glycoside hydrolase family 16 protein n=1 Tax=Nocardioides sp. AE5 TaxID=2962573 RepID=UPI002880F2FC|nr:glycoside hydrolase family 16 protein [Nocardioides sp. AE5]MDT0202522.1 glycoside hydrolase family 16 protein [Nocardioides sp. AE5]